MRTICHHQQRNPTDATWVKILQNWLERLQQESSSEKCFYIKIRKNHFVPPIRGANSPLQLHTYLPKEETLDALQLQSSSEPCTGRCFGIQPANWQLSYTQITTFVLKKLQHPTIKKLSFDRLLCRNPPPHLMVGPWVWLYLMQFTTVHIKIILL